MRTAYILAFVATGLFQTAGAAEVLKVDSVEKLAHHEGFSAYVPAVSAYGNVVVATQTDSDMLKALDLRDGSVKTVSADWATEPMVSPDGTRVVYRKSSLSDGLVYKSLVSVDLTTGKSETLVAPTRQLNAGVRMDERGVAAVADGELVAKGFAKAAAPKGAVVSVNRGHLEVNVDGKSTFIDPQGRGSYLWPALSPDGTKVAYYLAGEGCFVAGFDGSDPVALGLIRAPKWYGDSIVVGMRDEDDGEQVTSSRIVAADLMGNTQTLTSEDVIAMYPAVAEKAAKIFFATPAGDLYIIHLAPADR